MTARSQASTARATSNDKRDTDPVIRVTVTASLLVLDGRWQLVDEHAGVVAQGKGTEGVALSLLLAEAAFDTGWCRDHFAAVYAAHQAYRRTGPKCIYCQAQSALDPYDSLVGPVLACAYCGPKKLGEPA